MMTVEKFEEKLFCKLYNVRKIAHDRLFVIGKDYFYVGEGDIRVFMDSNMQHLVTLYPYNFSYVNCESDADHLVFLDILPVIKESEHEVEMTNFYYDCDNKRVCSFLSVIKLF